MKIPSVIFISLLTFSAPSFAGLKCSDLNTENKNYHKNMEELAKQARFINDRYNRYHEDAVFYICNGKSKEIAMLVDSGYVRASEVEAIKETIGKTSRSETGLSYEYSKKKFLEMELCNACASNVAHYYTTKPTSRCGILAKRALEGNPQAIEELQSSPPYCH